MSLNEIKTKNAAWTNVTRADLDVNPFGNCLSKCVCVLYDVTKQTLILKLKTGNQSETCRMKTWSSILDYIWSISNLGIYNKTCKFSLNYELLILYFFVSQFKL